MSIYVSEQSK